MHFFSIQAILCSPHGALSMNNIAISSIREGGMVSSSIKLLSCLETNEPRSVKTLLRFYEHHRKSDFSRKYTTFTLSLIFAEPVPNKIANEFI